MTSKEHNRALKVLIMNTYGNGYCKCCGETEMAFLSLDHIKGGGAVSRRIMLGLPDDYRSPPAGNPYYRALQKAGFPNKEDMQVLCLNCNRAKHDLGICPHLAKGN